MVFKEKEGPDDQGPTEDMKEAERSCTPVSHQGMNMRQPPFSLMMLKLNFGGFGEVQGKNGKN